MTTSGTYNFAPSLGDMVLAAYRRCGIHSAQLTSQHMLDARFEAGLLMSDWAGDGINLWQVQEGVLTLADGTITYAMPTNLVFLLDVYISTGSNPATDRLIFPLSRSDYAAIAVKTTAGPPTSFWFDRLISPEISLYPVPDADDTYTMYYYYMRTAQDSVLGEGTQPEVPWYFLDAFCAGLAARLSLIYAADRTDRLEIRYQRAFTRANQVGSENVPVQILPQMRGYFR